MGERYVRWIWPWIPLAIFLPYFNPSVLPFHDTLWKYECFHYLYRNWVNFGELPLWAPYGTYGVPQGFLQLALVSPSSYLFALIGSALHVTNTLILFKLSVLLDFLLYSAGLYLFAREAYRSPWSVLLVFLAGVASFSWIVQSHLNFYMFYLLPLALWALHRFTETRDARLISFLLLIEAISCIGSIPYFMPLHLLLLTIIVAVLVRTKSITLGAIEYRKAISWQMIAVALLSVILIASAYSAVHNTVVLAVGRDVNSFRVPLHTFLDYGRMTPGTTLAGVLTGAIPNADVTYYIGLLPLALAFWGMFKVDKPFFIALAAAAVALIWLSIGGWFARLVYLFPGMMLYRHVGLTFAVTGLLLILASGFVLDRLLEGGEPLPKRGKWYKAFKIAFVLMGIDLVISWRKGDLHSLEPISKYLLVLFAVRLLMYAWAYRRYRTGGASIWRNPAATRVIAAIFLFDIVSFQFAVQWTIPAAQQVYPAATFQPDKLEFVPTRSNDGTLGPVGAERLAIIKEHANQRHASAYAFIYNWMGADPCYPAYRNDLWDKPVVEAFTARGGHLWQWNGPDFMPPNDPGWARAVGCGHSKVRVVRQYVSAHGTDDATVLKTVPDPSRTLVIRDAPAEAPLPAPEGDAGTAQVTAFDANRIAVAADVQGTTLAWLYYADAWDERWKATVDGEPAQVYRANVGFKAVRVPPGKHEVLMEFTGGKIADHALALAGVISVLFLAGWLAWRLRAVRPAST